ncbi:lipocalin family protein [Pseudoxanthomonas sp. GM95]|uniref:lipocalin family protein n=1 Tax=Pseudoxanthomonas sp. GM95 TaxID=1881043 RepID=UPI000B811F89|nr:lipocalin family protein [Pseudoxanthomonas sp. GM95]
MPIASAPATPPIDLPRFMGAWHVIAHVPYFGERGHVASRDEYTLRPNGSIGVHYVYQEGFGEPIKDLNSRATVKDGSGNRRWTTWFFSVIPTKYRILETAPDYSWALVDYPGRDLAWIFSRSADLPDAQYAELVAKMKAHGVDTTKLVRVPQLAEQEGQPGFAPPKKPRPR